MRKQRQDLNMRLAAASQELLIICHEHQSVHRHVSFPSQLLSHRAFSVRSYDTATLWGSWNRLGDCWKKENNRKRRMKAWSALLRVQKEGSPQIKLTTLLVSKEWLFLTLCTAGSVGSGNCNNFLFSSTLLIPGLVTNRVAGRKSGERGRSAQQFLSLKRSVQMAFFAQLSFAVKTARVQWNMVVWAKCLRDNSGCLQVSQTSI